MSTGLEVADIFRRHGGAYRGTHDGHLGRVERRVMSAIALCRTAALGGHVERCEDCGGTRVAYNSCRNRHCPKCQGQARAEWLAARQIELLPAPYFHVVFTLPAPVAAIAFQNKAAVYAILFKAAAETLRVIAADPKHLGAEIGFVAVLHTWGQTLHHHPHVHCVVPGGGLPPACPGPPSERSRWVACRPGFFLPVRVLSRLFRRPCHTKIDGLGRCAVGHRDAAHLLGASPVPSRDHPARSLALSPVHAQLPRCRGTPGRARHRGVPRNRPPLGAHLWPGKRTQAAGETPEATQPLAPG
jgi:hypothetical protein